MKDKILGCALVVFNRKGIKNSTLRDIALLVPISDGHLRYYYKTKESLILTLFSQMEQEIVSFVSPDILTSPTAQTLVTTLTKSFEVMDRYSFFFTESPALLVQYPTLNKAYQQLMANRKELFLGVFERYRQLGIFRKDQDGVLYAALFEQFFILTDNWVKYARLPLAEHPVKSESITHYVAVCLAILLPYFEEPLRADVTIWVKSVYR